MGEKGKNAFFCENPGPLSFSAPSSLDSDVCTNCKTTLVTKTVKIAAGWGGAEIPGKVCPNGCPQGQSRDKK